jgi:serine/threonine protein kinase
LLEKTTPLQIGRVIRGYCLERLLVSETATLLYHAHTEELWLPPEVLIRLIPLPETFTSSAWIKFLQRFEREAHNLIRLRHSSLFPLYGYGEFDGMVYLLSPCAAEETLATRLQRQRHWTPTEAFALLTPLAAALDMLHQSGLVCQFLNPSWIFLPAHQPPQIANARLAQMVCCDGLDLPSEPVQKVPACLRAIDQSPLGAAAYLAPEVIKGSVPDARSDIYSLGVLLFELLCGQPPFNGTDYLMIARRSVLETPPSLHEVAPDLPAALEVILNRALHHDPRVRYQSARKMMVDCSAVLHERIRTSNFSLRAALLAQRDALPALEQPVQPLSIAAPVFQAPERGRDILPSSPEEQIADAWLNTPQEMQSSSPTFPSISRSGVDWETPEPWNSTPVEPPSGGEETSAQARRGDPITAGHVVFSSVLSQGETH